MSLETTPRTAEDIGMTAEDVAREAKKLKLKSKVQILTMAEMNVTDDAGAMDWVMGPRKDTFRRLYDEALSKEGAETADPAELAKSIAVQMKKLEMM